MTRCTFALVISGILAGGVPSARCQCADTEPCATSACVSRVPKAAGFVGLGGGYCGVDFADQDIFAQGDSRVFENGSVVAVGAAGGGTPLDFDSISRCASLAQVGFFSHFTDSDWLWGAKASYSYLGATSTNRDVLVPQAGSFTGVDSSVFTGNVVVRAYHVGVNHQLAFTPFVGRSFASCFPYVGAGPTLAQTRTKLSDVIGFADINGATTNITGPPTTFSSSEWVWGGTAVVGLSYFFNSSWFLDCNYAVAFTEQSTSRFAAPFANTTAFTTTGIVSGNYSGRAVTHSIGIALNRAF